MENNKSSRENIFRFLVVCFLLTAFSLQPANRRKKDEREKFSKCLSMVIPRSYAKIKLHPELTPERDHGKEESAITWSKKSPIPFSELLVSWNASRPKNGSFVFFVKIKHHHWSDWKKIAEWGRSGQKTFGNTKNRYVHAKHVRVEMQRGRLGFAYKIKVIAKKGADIRRLRALFANVANEKNFKTNTRACSLPSVCLKNFPKQSQFSLNHGRRKDLCSPTSLCMVTEYFVRNYKLFPAKENLAVQIKKFAPKVLDKTLNIYGNWLFNVAQAYSSTRGNVLYHVERLENFKALHTHLMNKIPVPVSIRGTLRGGAWPYNNGHFVVVIGWNNKTKQVLCVDPAFKNKNWMVRKYHIKDFLRAWGRSRHLSYIPTPKRGLATKKPHFPPKSRLFCQKMLDSAN